MLKIAPGLELPVDFVTQSTAVLARRGAGKTYTGSVIVEEVIKAGVPCVILDPTGAWWGLRSSIDGQKPGLPVVIFGGDHADVPLERKAGTIVANVVLEHPGFYIIDFSAFESRGAEIEFATHFLERLYRGKKRETGPLLLVVDEADSFAPQNPFGDEKRNEPSQKRTLGALESIVRRGRIKGLGSLLITQRSAVLNKNVLSQTEILVAMQNTAPQDRAAIDEWVKAYGTAEQRTEVMGSIAALEQGEAWFWSPTFLKILQRVKIRARRTFDSSRTPEVGETLPTVTLAKIDIQKLGAEIQATVEQAEANDPVKLQAEIRRLRAELATRPTEERIVEKIVEVEKNVVDPTVVVKLRAEIDRLEAIADAVAAATQQISSDVNRVSPTSEITSHPVPASTRVTTPPPVSVTQQARPHPISGMVPPPPTIAPSRPTPPPSLTNGEAKPLKAGAVRMLEAIAKLHPRPMTRAQVGMMANISIVSGTVSDYLSLIRPTGYLQENSDGTMQLTEAGVAAFSYAIATQPPTPQELADMWGQKLKSGAKRMLDRLVEVYPTPLSRDELADAAGVSKISGTVSDYLSLLRRAGLLDESRGGIAASDALFLGTR